MVLRIGLVGCGNISQTYLRLQSLFPAFEITAVADLVAATAQKVAAEHGLRALSVADLIASPDLDCVLNLTIPQAHVEVRQDTRFDALSVSINELKSQVRETNTLLRELAQRP